MTPLIHMGLTQHQKRAWGAVSHNFELETVNYQILCYLIHK